MHVVRCFENSNIVHVDGSIDPLRDIETINLELIFSDLEILERRIAKTTKVARNDKAAAKELAEKIEKLTVTLKMKAGEGGKAFGSVSSKEIAAAAADQLKLDIDKKKLVLPEPIKTFGNHEVPVKLHKDVTAKLTVKVTEA